MTDLELKQMLGGIEQANKELVAALEVRHKSQHSINGKHSEDRIRAAIRAHRAAIAAVWQPAPAHVISAAKPSAEAAQDA
jgi:hypothetical protein